MALLRLGRLQSLSPILQISLPPPVVGILTASTVPLLSLAWGDREDTGVLVVLAEWGSSSSFLCPPSPPLQLLRSFLHRRCVSGLYLPRPYPGSDSFSRVPSTWGPSTSWSTSPRSCICGASHCPHSFSTAFFAPWGSLYLLSLGPHTVRLALCGCGSSSRPFCDSVLSTAGYHHFVFILYYSSTSRQDSYQDRAFQTA